ncbi:MAG: phage tail family protein [Firmicutes bacterium]|nr:phage tail family protein [Bacillota bacterium]
MFKVTLTSDSGSIMLTNNPAYTVTSVSGLDPANANVNLSENALFDGATFNSSKVSTRNIVINFAINKPAGTNRVQLYKTVKPKRSIRVYVENSGRKAYIDGYVESLSVDMFAGKEVAQISILCPYPFFTDKASPYTATGDMVLTADNSGDVETGLNITITANGGEVFNPYIQNMNTGDTMTIRQNMLDGDIITINTNTGKRSVTLTRSGTTTNIINALDLTSKWLTLGLGTNEFEILSAFGEVYIQSQVTYNVLYQGV